MKKKAVLSFLLLLGTFLSKAQTPSFTVSPSKGEANKALTVKITGNNTTFGKNGSCTGSNCSDLGSFFYFNTGSTTLQVPYQSVSLTDGNHSALVDVVLPSISGTWQVRTENGLQANNTFAVTPKPVPYVSISPNTGVEGQPLTVTITGTDVKLGHDGSCQGENCLDIGSAMYFTQSSLTGSKAIPYESVNIIDSNHIEATITLPANGLYSTTTAGMYTAQFTVLKKPGTFTMSPTTAKAGETVKISLASSTVNFSYNGYCLATQCHDLGYAFLFGNIDASFHSMTFIDSNHVDIEVTVPDYEGSYSFKTSSGLEATQNFVITPNLTPSISISPNTGIEYKPLTVTITGTNTKLGYNGSCAGEGCLDIGTAMYFTQSSFSVQKTVPYQSVNIIDSNHIEVSIVPPSQGSYSTTIGGMSTDYFYVLDDIGNDRYIDISPTTAEAGKTITVSLSSNGFNLGYNGSCVDSNCRDLGNKLLFGGYGVDYQSVNLIDSNHAEVVVTVPYGPSEYSVETETDLKANQTFTITPKPAKSISISPNQGIEGQLLKVTITGNNTNLGYDGSCTGDNCEDLYNYFYFFAQASLNSRFLNFESVNIVDSNHIEISVFLPAAGEYNTWINDVNTGTFTVLKDPSKKRFTMTPNTAEEGKTVSILLSSDDVNFGYNGSCTGSNCTDLGSELFFSTAHFNFQSVNLIDSNHAEVVVTVPYSPGYYPVETSTGLVSDQHFVVTPKPMISVSMAPYQGIEGQLLTVTITGNNTNLGYNGSCVSENCLDIGSALFFQQSSFTFPKTVPFQSVNILDSNHIEASIVLPSQGDYNVKIGDVYVSYFHVLDNGESDKYITMSPITAEAGRTIKVSLSSETFNLGYNGSCTGSNCVDLGTKLLFGSTPVNFQSVSLIDSNHAEVVITVPGRIGTYYIETETDLKVGQTFFVKPKPNPSISLTPNEGIAGKPLTVTITGNYTNLGYQGSCSGDNCFDISDQIYFFTNSTVTNNAVSYQSVNVVDSNHIEVSIVLPSVGNYYTKINDVYSTPFTVVAAKKAELSGTQTTCHSYASLYVKFSGTPPWSFTYESTDGTHKNYSGITNPDFSFNVNLSGTQTYTIVAASDANGPCQISGSATVTTTEMLSAELQHDTASLNPRTYVLTLTGKSPWVVTINNNGQLDSLLVTENTHTFSVDESSYYDVYLVGVKDANCTNGHLRGLNGIITGINGEASASQLNVYPNPSSGTVNVNKGTESIFYNNLGEQVYKSSQESFDVSHLAPGLYTLHLSNAGQRSIVKFVKE